MTVSDSDSESDSDSDSGTGSDRDNEGDRIADFGCRGARFISGYGGGDCGSDTSSDGSNEIDVGSTYMASYTSTIAT